MATDKSKEELENEELENEKLRNEIKLQNIEIANKNKLTGWRKKLVLFFDPIKDWGQTLATLFLGVVGIVFTISNNNHQQVNTNMMQGTNLMAERERSETDFRQTMFLPLINQILNDTLSLKQRMNVFDLFENNFNDLFDSRPLYDVLWDTAQNAHDSDIEVRLINLARYIGAKQESEINEMEYRDTLCHRQDTIDHKFIAKDDPGQEHVLITLDTIDRYYVWITMTIECIADGKSKTIKISNGKSFHVSYFDTPFSNNFMMPDGDRMAIVLEEVKPDYARLDVVHFPGDFVTVGYRPSMQRVNNIIGKKN